MNKLHSRMCSQFLFLRQHLSHYTIDERKQYCHDLGSVWIDLINQPNIFLDERDYNLYSTIEVNGNTWLGENLRYDTPGSWLNPDNPDITYGRLYDWNIAMKSAPQGWHLPSDEEMDDDVFKDVCYAGYYDSGSFNFLGDNAFFWSSTVFSGTYAWIRSLFFGFTGVYRNNYYKSYGGSCRYIKKKLTDKHEKETLSK